MIILGAKEQKEILGGRWVAIIFGPGDEIYDKAYYRSKEDALNWALENSVGKRYAVYEVN